ncbi:Alpha/beta hydrolase family protein [Candidatus Hepatincolaceae symbiont of Richtersius coronifer]
MVKLNRISISSGSGRLEGIYKSATTQENSPCVLLLHPHPFYGGNMHSKVLFVMEKAFLDNNFSTLKFNFSGVGGSEGEQTLTNGAVEINDASAALDWLQNKNEKPRALWVAGFSFGAYIALQTMARRREIDRFIGVGLPANMFDMSFLYPCTTNGLFVHGEKDDIAPLNLADKVIKKAMRTVGSDIKYHIINNADHYFNKHSEELYQILYEYIKKELELNYPV